MLRERIELSTSPLPRECSTTELPQLPHKPVKMPALGARMSHRPQSEASGNAGRRAAQGFGPKCRKRHHTNLKSQDVGVAGLRSP